MARYRLNDAALADRDRIYEYGILTLHSTLGCLCCGARRGRLSRGQKLACEGGRRPQGFLHRD